MTGNGNGAAASISSGSPAAPASSVRRRWSGMLAAGVGRVRRRLLFWKILLGFWLTFLLILEGVWAMFALYDQPIYRPPEIRSSRALALARLDQVETALHFGELAAVREAMTHWPADQQRRLRWAASGRAAASGAAGATAARDAAAAAPAIAAGVAAVNVDGDEPRPNDMVRTVRSGAGVSYLLRYDATPPERRAKGPFDMPKEMVLLSILGGLLFSAALARYLTQPVQRLRRGFERLAQGELDVRLRPEMSRRRDEIADLARDFDSMAERLQQLVAAREQLLHDVSHELRSPLARLHLAAGLARQNPARYALSLDRIEFEAKRIDQMVGELLTLSRVESGAPALDDYFDLDGLVMRVVEDARFEAQPSGVAIVCNIEHSAAAAEQGAESLAPTVKGNAELMRRALENIVRNALRFSQPGQQVTVTVTGTGAAVDSDDSAEGHDHTPGYFTIGVADQGPGMAPSGLTTMFEPFVRGGDDAAETGFGLGLAIAQRAVLAHGGTIAAHNRESDGRRRGLVVTLRLPVSSAVSV